MGTRVCCGAAVFFTVFLALLTPLTLPATGQPQGYTLVYSAPIGYAEADWMNFKALYVKTENNRLYFYLEYYGAIPSSRDHYRDIYIRMDTDRNNQTGSSSRGLGLDYGVNFQLYGDNSSSAMLFRWDSTSRSWKSVKGFDAEREAGSRA